VASYPHKREGGKHVIADTNMAGCNGFWDLDTMREHIERIKKLFAPEMCFEYELRKQLKSQFMSSFVSMNQEFEKAMAGTYTRKLHDLDPTKNTALDLIKDKTVEFEDVANVSTLDSKYLRMAHLIAKAHSKWVICDAKEDKVEEAFGNEDNFFRDPKAYSKWIGDMGDDTKPECKTLDDTTGCVKCAVAVKDKYGCHVRLNTKLKDIYMAIKTEAYPFLMSKMKVRERFQTEDGTVQTRIVEKQSACLVRKSVASIHNARRHGLEAIKSSFFQVNDTDAVVQLHGFGYKKALEARDKVASNFRYNILERREELAQWRKEPEAAPQSNELDELASTIGEEDYVDPEGSFPEKYIFTDYISELSNRPAHKVDYFVSCPCSKDDFQAEEFFATTGSQGMAEYYNR
jgi:hypothetical protein